MKGVLEVQDFIVGNMANHGARSGGGLGGSGPGTVEGRAMTAVLGSWVHFSLGSPLEAISDSPLEA
jgi:hypothetical protein